MGIWGKMGGKENAEEMWKERKKKIEVNKLFYIILQTHFIYFHLFLLNNLKIYKFLINLNYIWFSFVFFIVKPNMRKPFSVIYYFYFLSIFEESKHNINILLTILQIPGKMFSRFRWLMISTWFNLWDTLSWWKIFLVTGYSWHTVSRTFVLEVCILLVHEQLFWMTVLLHLYFKWSIVWDIIVTHETCS